MVDIICLYQICIYVYICDIHEYRVSHHYHFNLCHCHYPQRKLFQECTTWYNYFIVDEHITNYTLFDILLNTTFFFLLFFQIPFSYFFLHFSEFLVSKYLHTNSFTFSNKIFLNFIKLIIAFLSLILESIDRNTFCL